MGWNRILAPVCVYIYTHICKYLYVYMYVCITTVIQGLHGKNMGDYGAGCLLRLEASGELQGSRCTGLRSTAGSTACRGSESGHLTSRKKI